MASILPGFEYDIFISYRHNDNRSGWVTDFVNALQEELAATVKEPLSIYFDKNPHDGLLETHNVDKSLEGKLKCLIFIPIISQTYCDPKSFAWQHEFLAFNKSSKEDQFGRDIKLSRGNVASRILPIKIHELDEEDKSIVENEINGVLRAVEFIFKSAGVNRSLRVIEEHPQDNLNKTFYRDQVNKVANAVKEIITSLKSERKTEPLSHPNQAFHKPKEAKVKSLIIVSSLIILLAIVGYFIYPRMFQPKEMLEEDKSIAVLPFVNMSTDAEQEYFSDGITEQIITNLAHINSLKIIARTSVMKYKKTNKSIAEIGRELNVTHVLEGSIRKADDRIRVTAQLISTKDETHIWAQDYDRKLADIFTVQDEISMAIANSLQRELTSRDYESLKSDRSSNVEAYQHYLKGYKIHMEQYYMKRLKEDFFTAETEFKTAIQLDSTYALAYASLADLYDTYFNFSANTPDERLKFQKLRDKFSAIAYTINANNPYVITVRAYTFISRLDRTEADVDSAFRLRKKALSISPNNVDVCDPLSVTYRNQGLYYQALQLRERCVSLDPTFGNHYAELGNLYIDLGEFQKAESVLQKAILLQPDAIAGLQGWALLMLHTNHLQEAERAIKKINETNPEINTNFLEAYLLARKGEKEKALGKSKAVAVYLALGMKAEAIEAIEKSPPPYLILKNSPLLADTRNEPRFQVILDKAKVIYDERLKKYVN